jgi:hypothetical protein
MILIYLDKFQTTNNCQKPSTLSTKFVSFQEYSSQYKIDGGIFIHI